MKNPREEGAIYKDWGGRLPVAVIYPNSYYLGMSNLGIHAVYRLLNEYDNVVGERAFWEKANSEKNRPPLSLESGRPLRDFAALAFSVSYELDYFNVIAMIKSSGIPLYAADRDERHPLLIAGGPCITANPQPLSPFFDCLCIGEAEPILPSLLPVLREGITGNRRDLLNELAGLPGVYVPALPPETPVIRQWARDLDSFATTSAVITDNTELRDLYLIEAERGCRRVCRFCLVNGIFAPARFRSVDSLIAQAEGGRHFRERIGLIGPAVTDHPDIIALLERTIGIGAQVSISSLRIGSLSEGIIDLLAKGNARTITMAPEAGPERLRRLINKGVSDSDIIEIADTIGGYRFKNLKLYFMMGLPSETDADTEAIIELAQAIKSRLDKHGRGTRLNLNIAPFVPKAGTPFQWLPMASLETLNRRLAMLRKALPPRGIILKTESPAWSRIQGILSRGDDRLAGALASTDKISLAAWRQAAVAHNLDADYYINQKWDTAQRLPWDIIDSGRHHQRLAAEMERALSETG